MSQYQRRADLVPNPVNTVKRNAAHEERVLTKVTQTRAQATSIQVTPTVLNDAAAERIALDCEICIHTLDVLDASDESGIYLR